MEVKAKAKEKKEIFFKDIKVGQVFRKKYSDYIFMKVFLEDDFIVCPNCDEDIRINDEKGSGFYAVELSTGLVYEFDSHLIIEVAQGAFIEE